MRIYLAAWMLVLGAAAVEAKTVVLRATGPSAASYPSGRTLPEPFSIVLRQGDTLTLLDGRGTTVLKGPKTLQAQTSVALSVQDYAFVNALTQARPKMKRVAGVSFNLDVPSPPAAAAESPADGVGFSLGRKGAASGPARPAVAAAAKPRPAARPAAPADLGSGITFTAGTADLTPEAKQKLDLLAATITRPEFASARFRIEGHVDSSQPRATAVSLSTNRAKAVATYLVSRGVDASRLESIGYGFDRPLPGVSPASTSNRRIVIQKVDGAGPPLPVASPPPPAEPGLWDIDPSAGSQWCVEPSGDIALFRPIAARALSLSIAGADGPATTRWPAGDNVLRLPKAIGGADGALRIGWRDASQAGTEQSYQLTAHRLEAEPDSIRALALAFDVAGCDVQLARLEAIYRSAP